MRGRRGRRRRRVRQIEKDGKLFAGFAFGFDDGIRVEITEGLGDGDEVVTTGKSLITPDAPVTAVMTATPGTSG